MTDIEKLKAIEEKLKELQEFGCDCKQEAAEDLLVEFFPSEEMAANSLYKKFYGEK